ncbi:MAG: Flp pilus assembly protein CpaB [Actinobacteria bacterium]|nr:Flp pilus assembly protein CpaB [Actinomycetota bacterium]
MGRRVMAVLAAMLVGFIGVVAVLLYAKGADSRAVADQRPQTVFIAQELVPSGTTAADAVAKGLMVPAQIAAKGVPVGALTKVDGATGKLVALTDIVAGDFVVASRFGTTPLGQKAIQVPDGLVAVSVSLSDPGRVGTFVTPGSRIVIFDTYVPSAAGTKETRVLLDDVLVIAVGSTSLTPVAGAGGQAPAADAGALVTVAIPPATAAKLVHAIQTGTLYAGLRGTDTKANLGQIVSDATLFNK